MSRRSRLLSMLLIALLAWNLGPGVSLAYAEVDGPAEDEVAAAEQPECAIEDVASADEVEDTQDVGLAFEQPLSDAKDNVPTSDLEHSSNDEIPAEGTLDEGDGGEASVLAVSSEDDELEAYDAQDPELVPQASHAVPTVTYQAHVQRIGWQAAVKDGKVAGTSGKSLRVEALKVSVFGNAIPSGSVQYRSHVQKIGWQDWVADGAVSGTFGRSLRVEAFQMRLTGELAEQFDIYYRVHVQSIGWMGWAKNGELAGTAGKSLRMEAVQVQLVRKGGEAPSLSGSAVSEAYRGPVGLTVRAHVQSIGWQNAVGSGETAGTTGKSLRVEALKLSLEGASVLGGIRYATHVQSIGWQDWVSNGAVAGTSGRSLRVEALKCQLTGAIANSYDLYYRVHAQSVGWMSWAKNGEVAGTSGMSKRIEALQVALVPKGSNPPDASDATTDMHYLASTSVTMTDLSTYLLMADTSPNASGKSELSYRFSWRKAGEDAFTVLSGWSDAHSATLSVSALDAGQAASYELVIEQRDAEGHVHTVSKTVSFAPSKGTKEDLLEVASADIGYFVGNDKETGSKYGRWYEANVNKGKVKWDYGADNVAYCAMAVSYWLDAAQVLASGLPRAGCEGIYFAAQADGRTVKSTDLQAGMLVLFDGDGDKLPDHVGIVEKRIDSCTYQTIEGNTSRGIGGSQDNGGWVARRQRDIGSILCGVVPYYTSE